MDSVAPIGGCEASLDLTSAIPLLFFTLFFAIFIATFVRNMRHWHKNNQAPRLTVSAAVVTKRTHHSGSSRSSGTTRYYATFEVESGDRFELMLDGYEYGLLIEGDRGRLTFQGTRFLGFERE